MIVVGASLGGLQSLPAILHPLPKGFGLPIAVVLHRHKDSDTQLAEYLQNGCALPVEDAWDKQVIEAGRVYLAPPDYQLMVEPSHFSLSTDEPVNFARPSVDVLFESAAESFGSRAIGVILTGAGSDGARGAALIKERGGILIVEDPATAECAGMPRAVLAATQVDHVLPRSLIAQLLVSLDR